MERVCFVLKLKPDRIEEYVDRHRNVWPEMRAALRETGWRNYSLFLAPDGLVIGYLETDSFDEARRQMNELPINERWQIEMMPFFDHGQEKADQSMRLLPELFHLD